MTTPKFCHVQSDSRALVIRDRNRLIPGPPTQPSTARYDWADGKYSYFQQLYAHLLNIRCEFHWGTSGIQLSFSMARVP